jgi:tetratricopeptide (TPR) repeat protein
MEVSPRRHGVAARSLARSILAAAICGAPAVAASPFIPTDDGEVLESGLPTTDPRARQIQTLAMAFDRRPDDLDLAMRLAGRRLAMGVAESDPRFVGYAKATLARWWIRPGVPATFTILKARILQAEHDFTGARVALRAALEQEPGNPQALLVLAAIDTTTGELDEASEACKAFSRSRPGLAATACISSVESLTGHAAESYAALGEAVYRNPSRDPGTQAWALTILGEIAIRLGDAAAERHLKEALAVGPGDVYTLGVYADHLLEQGRAAKVLVLLNSFRRVDTLYLRLALAAQAIGDPALAVYREELTARIAAARAQGDDRHLRDAARFALELDRDPRKALGLARRNWTIQRTPADAQVLLKAALAAGEPGEARPIAEWVAKTGLEDRALDRLLGRLGPRN